MACFVIMVIFIVELNNIMTAEEPTPENPVWLDEYGIVHIFQDKPFTRESVSELAALVKEALLETEGHARILYRLTKKMKGSVTSPEVRKKLVDAIKAILDGPGFERAAVYEGNTATRTIASFIVALIGNKKIKIFKSKDNALKWLKKP